MEPIIAILTRFSELQSYAAFFFILIGCGIGLPFNSDLVLISAGVLSVTWILKVQYLFPIAVAGLLLGDSVNYFVAKRYGQKILAKRPFCYLLSPEKVKRGEIFFQMRGANFVFFIRFLPLIRTVLYFTAGTLKVPAKRFFILDASSTVLYLLVVLNLARSAALHADVLWQTLKQFQFIFLGTFCTIAAILYFKSRQNARKRQHAQ